MLYLCIRMLLNAQLLMVGKFSNSKELNDYTIFNKVDMLQYNYLKTIIFSPL